MGKYINPDNLYYADNAAHSPFVDKTEMIAELNKIFGPGIRGRVCMNRPRRFGKTLTANMLSAYYSCGCDSRELFQDMKLAQLPDWDKWLNKCNVLKIDLGNFCGFETDNSDSVERMNKAVIEDIKREFPDIEIRDNMYVDEAISAVYLHNKRPFVFIMDEYDSFVRTKTHKDTFAKYLEMLNRLFKTDANAEEIQLAYLTGILPIVKDRFGSKLNNFKEFTMVDPDMLAKYMGFTKDEVKKVCDESGIDFNECLKWYDGYKLDNEVDVSSPYSVAMAAIAKKFRSHWSSTGSFLCLKDYIEMDFKGIRADVVRFMNGEHLPVNVDKFQNVLNHFTSKDDIFTYLIHLGYLAYNSDTGLAYIPNREVMQEWHNSVEDSERFTPIIEFVENSRNLLYSTIEQDAKAVADALDFAHEEVTSSFSYNNEQSLQSALTLAYYFGSTEYNIYKELPAGKGFADMAFIPIVPSPDRPAIIVELKWDKTPALALKQIREKRYANALKNYKGNIIIAAVTYNPTDKKHTCEFSTEVR